MAANSPLYLLFMFYPTPAEAAKQVREAKAEIEQPSGGNYKAVVYGGATTCLAFVSDTPFGDTSARLATIKGEH